MTMHDYNAWADLLQTWRSTSDWIKAVVVIAAFAYPVMVLQLLLSHRRAMRRAETQCGLLAVRIRSMAFPHAFEEDWPEEVKELERVVTGVPVSRPAGEIRRSAIDQYSGSTLPRPSA
jgi:hypothetical protein